MTRPFLLRRLALRLGRIQGLMIVAAGLVLAAVFTRPVLAADVSGTWEITCRIGDSRQDIVVELVQKGRRLSGSGSVSVEGGGAAVPVLVGQGVVRGNHFRFSIARAGAAAELQTLVGAWRWDEMSGIATGTFGGRMFTGVRRRVDR